MQCLMVDDRGRTQHVLVACIEVCIRVRVVYLLWRVLFFLFVIRLNRFQGIQDD